MAVVRGIGRKNAGVGRREGEEISERAQWEEKQWRHASHAAVTWGGTHRTPPIPNTIPGECTSRLPSWSHSFSYKIVLRFLPSYISTLNPAHEISSMLKLLKNNKFIYYLNLHFSLIISTWITLNIIILALFHHMQSVKLLTPC